MEAGDAIRSFIRTELVIDPDEPLETDTPLLEGLLDSGDLMRVVTFVEEHFGISVEDRDLVPENFGTIGALDRYIGSRTARV